MTLGNSNNPSRFNIEGNDSPVVDTVIDSGLPYNNKLGFSEHRKNRYMS